MRHSQQSSWIFVDGFRIRSVRIFLSLLCCLRPIIGLVSGFLPNGSWRGLAGSGPDLQTEC